MRDGSKYENYETLDRLYRYYSGSRIKIERDPGKDLGNMSAVEIALNNSTHHILLDDEYNDLDAENRLFDFFLVLRAVSVYNDAEDFLEWFRENTLDSASSAVLTTYRDMGAFIRDFEECFGPVPEFHWDHELQLGSGVVDKLRAVL